MSDEKRRSLVGALLPKTLAGLAMWVLMVGIGMAASGVAFYAFYAHQLETIKKDLTGFSEKFDEDFKKRSKEFTQLVKDSKAEIERASAGSGSQTNEVQSLLEKVGPSVAYVRGLDANKVPAAGSGFVVNSTSAESWIVTNFRLVAGSAATKTPVKVRLGTAERDAEAWSWDERRDLALLRVKVASLPKLPWETSEPKVGSVVWAIGAAPGKLKSAASKGFVMDNAADGYLIDADVPASAAGGVLVSRDGKAFGVLTLSYAPEGFPPSNGWVVPIRLTCQKVLRCPAA